ncbi:hypothetical protein LJC37_02420 [Bacteroidales bacterium OttesenSCG-928-E04]|nr:hypothetical protein [Bacteroidales bacterium OttesenSCG-928-E04]
MSDRLKWIRPLCAAITLLAFFLPSSSLSAQSNDCVNLQFFEEVYDNSTEEISRYLGKNGWLLLSSEFNEPLMLSEDTLIFNLAIWKNTKSSANQFVYLYHKTGLSHYLEVVIAEKCYTTLLDNIHPKYGFLYESKMIGNDIQSESAISTKKHVILQQRHKQTFTYHAICYNPLQIDSLIQVQRDGKFEAQLIYLQKKEHIENLLKKCESLAKNNDYESALVILDTLRGFLPEYDETISKRKELYREAIKKQKIATLTAQAEQLFDDRNLQEAMKVYESILRLDRENNTATIRIAQIKRMLDVLYLRSDILYDYKILNPDSWNLINNQLQTELNNTVSRSKKGSLDFTFTLYMDTIGRNASFYSMTQNTDQDFEKFLKSLAVSSMIKPTYKESISVASRYNFQHKLNWASFDFDLKKKKKGIKTSSNYRYLLNDDTFKKFINDEELPNGKYVFEVKEKRLDMDPMLLDMTLKQYKVVGREAFFYSLLLPGVGTMAATQGQKGYFSFISFFAAGGCSLAAYLQAQKLKSSAKYSLNTNNDQARHDRLMKEANAIEIASYIGFSVTGVIYITEAFRAMSKGGKNMKASKELRRSIKNNPKEVIMQDIRL